MHNIEFHETKKDKTEFRLTNLALAILAAISAAAIILCYAFETMYFYTFTFNLYGYQFSLRQLSYISMILTSLAIFVPMLIYDAKVVTLMNKDEFDDENSNNNGFLPTVMSHVHKFSTGVSNVHNKFIQLMDYVTTKNFFGIVFPFCCTLFAVTEFLIHEQVSRTIFIDCICKTSIIVVIFT